MHGTAEVCYWMFCFAPPGNNEGPKIFGFAEFIAALALLVIVFTVADIRYRFRVAVAPIPLYTWTFALIGVIGAGTLLTDIWLAQGWWIPKHAFLTRAVWQGFFASLFLATFMTWAWYAFVRPPIYGRRNAKRYTQELYNIIVRGADSELSIIADELQRSARSLVAFVPNLPGRMESEQEAATPVARLSAVEGYAHDLFLLIANRKFCRAVIASSPGTAITLFDAAAHAKKYRFPAGTFAKNISAEAIANRDSILYHEGDKFSSGLLGYIKPFSLAIYGNYSLVEGLGDRFNSPLDVDYREYWEWDANQWKAYFRVTNITLRAFLDATGGTQHSFVIFRAVHTIETAFRDAYKLQSLGDDYYSSDIYQRLEATVDFVKNAVDEINRQMTSPVPRRLRRRANDCVADDLYDLLVSLMFELVLAASSVSGPPDKAWAIHHNAVWMEFFTEASDSRTWKILQFKLRRRLYDEITRMDRLPNFKGARILGFCLNIVGFTIDTHYGNYDREYRALAKVVHAWARKGYGRLKQQSPRVAEAVLIGSITYDAEQNRLVYTGPQGLRTEAPKRYLQLPKPA